MLNKLVANFIKLNK